MLESQEFKAGLSIYINHDLGHCSCVDHFILSIQWVFTKLLMRVRSILAHSIQVITVWLNFHCDMMYTLARNVMSSLQRENLPGIRSKTYTLLYSGTRVN